MGNVYVVFEMVLWLGGNHIGAAMNEEKIWCTICQDWIDPSELRHWTGDDASHWLCPDCGSDLLPVTHPEKEYAEHRETTRRKALDKVYNFMGRNEAMNKQLYNEALAAIKKLFNDRSVTTSQTRENLQTLVDEIEMLLDTLPKG